MEDTAGEQAGRDVEKLQDQPNSPTERVNHGQSGKDNSAGNSEHLSGLNLTLIFVALCLAVFLVALVRIDVPNLQTETNEFRTKQSSPRPFRR